MHRILTYMDKSTTWLQLLLDEAVGRQLAEGKISRCYLRQLAGMNWRAQLDATPRVVAAPTFPRFLHISSLTNFSCAVTT